MAAKELLEGEIASLEIEITEELDLVDLDDDKETLREALEKLEIQRKDYVAKTTTLSKLDGGYDIAATTEKKEALAEAIKKIKLKRKELNKAVRESEELKEQAEKDAKKKEDEVKAAEEKKTSDQQKLILKVKKANLISKYELLHASQKMLYDDYNVSIRNVSDEEVLRRKEEMSTLSERFGQLEMQTTQCLADLSADLYFDAELKNKNDELMRDLGYLRDAKIIFENFVRQAVADRDLSGAKKEASAEILLDKFSGSEKGQDFYSFKTKFEKKYKNVKKAQIPDILKSFLEGNALESVKQLELEKEIWERLKSDFGDVNIMLKNKMTRVYEVAKSFGTKKSSRDLREILIDLNNKITDVVKLVKEHKIEGKLYSRHEVNDIIVKFPVWFTNSWYTAYVKLADKSDEHLWDELRKYLLNQAEIQKARAENEPVKPEVATPKSEKEKGGKGTGKSYYAGGGGSGCPLGCPKAHTEGKELKECPKFLRVKGPQQRFEALKSSRTKFCFQCLDRYTGPDHKSSCSSAYACPSSEHEAYDSVFHVAICARHCEATENIELFEQYKRDELSSTTWAAGIKLTLFSSYPSFPTRRGKEETFGELDDEEVKDEPLFLLQVVEIDKIEYNMFYDDGCGAATSTKRAVDKLKDRAYQLSSTPVEIGGVGQSITYAQHGLYKLRLPTVTGRNAQIIAPCFDEITTEFPRYPLQKVIDEMRIQARLKGINISEWPSTHSSCGGRTDLMIGQKYRRYYPEEVQRLPSGLSILKSHFYGPNKSTGVIGGPSQIITKMMFHGMHNKEEISNPTGTLHSYLTTQLETYKNGYQMDLDVSRFVVKEEDVEEESDEEDLEAENDVKEEKEVLGDTVVSAVEAQLQLSEPREATDPTSIKKKEKIYLSKKEKQFKLYDESACDFDYRCPRCRGCNWCLNAEKLNAVSLQEEGEQCAIEEAITVDVINREIRAKLPLSADPQVSLGENFYASKKIYKQQVLKLSKSEKDKEDVVKSEQKMQTRGHTAYYQDLPQDIRSRVEAQGWSHFIPWRSVWNSNSLTTSCRIVFDLSATTETGYSLNDLSPKGINQINNLVQVFIRWRLGLEALHSDITTMYPSVKVEPEYWGLQKYLWSEGLEPGVEPLVKVIMRVIIGGRSSGGLATAGVKKLADLIEKDFPLAAQILRDEIYVDDVLPAGQESKEACMEIADEIEGGLALGGMGVKGFTFSGQDPSPDLSSDGQSIGVAGMRWFSKEDKIKLSMDGTLNFSPKLRGKKATTPESYKAPTHPTRKQATGKVAEIWDLSGIYTPLVARFKLDLHTLVERGLDWDDRVPDDLSHDWEENFAIMKEMGHFKFRRALVPIDAKNLTMHTIEAGDASDKMIVVATYIRIERTNGEFSCSLALGKSKLVPKGMSLPRAELTAARLNSQLGHLVQRAMGDKSGERTSITDSEITLHWLNSWSKPLKQFVRGSVVQTLRLTEQEQWRWIPSAENPCDIGTRRQVSLEDVRPDGEWINGKPWMRGPQSSFPTKTVDEIKVSPENDATFKAEFAFKQSYNVDPSYIDLAREYEVNFGLVDRAPTEVFLNVNRIPQEMAKRIYRSQYLVDPSRFHFHKLVRILGLVTGYVRKLHEQVAKRENGELTIKDKLKGQGDTVVSAVEAQLQLCEPREAEDPSKTILFKSQDSVSLVEHFKWKKFDEVLVAQKKKKKSALSSAEIVKIRERLVKEMEVKPKNDITVICEEVDLDSALRYLFEKGTEEVEHFVPPKLWKDTRKVGKIRVWSSRALSTQEFSTGLQLSDVMLDLNPAAFCVPLLDEYSPIAWSVALHVHWAHPTAQHAGVPTVVRYCNEIAHIFNCDQIVQTIKKQCARCRFILKKTIEMGLGPLSAHQLKVAPPYCITQGDLFGPLEAFAPTNARQTIKIWGSVFVCLATCSCSIQVMENYSAGAFVQAYTRFSCGNGHVKVLLTDEGKNIEHGAGNMDIQWVNVKNQLLNDHRVVVETAPVGDHHEHGKVERMIRQIKQTLVRSTEGRRLTPLTWQTTFDLVANAINNLPIARNASSMSGVKIDVGNLDLVTPNRLRFARNNDMAPAGPILIPRDVTKMLSVIDEVFEVWWKCWLDVALPKLLHRDQGDKLERNLEEGDVVLLKRQEGDLAGSYRFGIVEEAVASADGKVRKVHVRYRNVSENADRSTHRGVGGVVLIRKHDEVDLWAEIFQAARISDVIKSFVYFE